MGASQDVGTLSLKRGGIQHCYSEPIFEAWKREHWKSEQPTVLAFLESQVRAIIPKLKWIFTLPQNQPA